MDYLSCESFKYLTLHFDSVPQFYVKIISWYQQQNFEMIF